MYIVYLLYPTTTAKLIFIQIQFTSTVAVGREIIPNYVYNLTFFFCLREVRCCTPPLLW